MRFGWSVLWACVCLLAAAPVGAQVAGERPLPVCGAPGCGEPAGPAQPEAAYRWYGWQTLLADGASGVLVYAAVEADAIGLLYLALPSAVFAPAIIHAAHGEWTSALLSVALRAGTAGAMYLAVAAARASAWDGYSESGNGGYESVSAVLLAIGGIGLFSSVVVDAVNAREPLPAATRVSAWLGPDGSAGGVAVLGRF